MSALIKPTREINDMLRRATILRHNFIGLWFAYENPEKGDEAPLIIYDTERKLVCIESPFWDADDPEEITDWLNAERSKVTAE